MLLPDSFLQELKFRCNIEDIVSNYVNLKRQGKTLSAICPFHNEKTPSFYVYPESGSFYCFGCGAGGDVITFIRMIENLDYIESVKFISQKIGLSLPESNYDDSFNKLKLRIYEANRDTAKFYHNVLFSPEGKDALDYLYQRDLAYSTIKHFGLGFSPNNRFALVNYLRKKGYTDFEIVQANLAFKGRSGAPFDRFFNRVMFPIIDLRGNVIAFGGRIIGDGKPKYLNTSDTPSFKKNSNLFALNFAKNSCDERLILSEGYMDVISLHQAGFENSVATLGTSLTQEQVKLISRYSNEVVIAYDSDEAGQKATNRAIELFRNSGVRIKVLTIPKGKDPDEFIRTNGKDGILRFKNLLEQSNNDIEYSLNKLKSHINLNVPEGKVKYLTQACILLSSIDNRFEREIYAHKLSEEVEVQKSSIMLQIEKLIKQREKKSEKKQLKDLQIKIFEEGKKVNPERNKNLRAAHAEEALIAFLMNNPDIYVYIENRLPPSKFLTQFNKMIYEKILKRIKDNKPISLTDLSQNLSIDEISYIAKFLAKYIPSDNLKKSVDEYIDIILYENNKITENEAANTSIDEIQKYIDRLKELKK